MRTSRFHTRQTLALCLLLGSGTFAAADQPETTALCDEGTVPEPVALAYGDATDGCGIDNSAADTDRFFFTAAAGDFIRIRLVTLSSDLDPVIEVRDATNTLVTTMSCTANSVSRCTTGETFELADAGDYLIIITDSGANNTGGYTLDLERILPPLASVAVSYNSSTSDTLSPSTDTDFFSFEASAGTELRINAVTLASDLDLRVQIYDPLGELVVDGISDGAGCIANSVSRCSFQLPFVPALSGTYSLQALDDDAFNTGGFQFSVLCVYGDCPGAPTPSDAQPRLSFPLTAEGSISTAGAGELFTFHGALDTTFSFRGVTLASDLDPRIEVRDPNGDVVMSGVGNGAGCDANSVSRCAFGFSFSPAVAGTYSVLFTDNDSFNTGGYRVSLLCMDGPCDSDGDSFPDGDRQVLSYGIAVTDRSVEPSTEGDFYSFMGTAGDEIKLTVTGQSSDFDPRIRVRDPNGAVIVDGIGDGGGCDANSVSVCSFAKTLFPAETGIYTVALFDNDGFNQGAYDVVLECTFGTGPGFTCADQPLPPFLCADNCATIANPLQTDSNADGYGNACDADLDGSGTTDFLDLEILKSVFFTTDADGDLNDSGTVDFQDLALMKTLFFAPPGPSCAFPNAP